MVQQALLKYGAVITRTYPTNKSTARIAVTVLDVLKTDFAFAPILCAFERNGDFKGRPLDHILKRG